MRALEAGADTCELPWTGQKGSGTPEPHPCFHHPSPSPPHGGAAVFLRWVAAPCGPRADRLSPPGWCGAESGCWARLRGFIYGTFAWNHLTDHARSIGQRSREI